MAVGSRRGRTFRNWTRLASHLSSGKLLALKLAFLVLLVGLTNGGAIDRMALQVTMHRPGALAIYLVIWGLALVSLIAIALLPGLLARFVWAGIVAASSAVAWGYQSASQIELTVFDGLSLWEARHEAGDAAHQYAGTVAPALALFAVAFAVLAVPVGRGPWRWSRALALLPAVPVALIGGVIYAKAGAGSFGMPKQFSQAAIAGLVAYKQLMQPMPAHAEVAWQPTGSQPVKKIVLLVDESIRADYLDTSGKEMPNFAAAMKDFADYGASASGGVCSNYSNTLLRFAAARGDLGPQLGASPTLWQFAKKAGYRTVYIDAQARNVTNLDGLQNFMTPAEAASIDALYGLKDFAPDAADMELARILKLELARDQPVFIYANKQGAHVPYEQNYPAAAAVFHPTISEAGAETLATRINSYRNSLLWNVDRFFAALWGDANARSAAIVYTSDHAQLLNPAGLTHCVSSSPNQRMALVPLYAHTGDPAVMAGLRQGAARSRGRASHFMIAPSLLQWMGYRQQDVATRYRESLSEGTPYAPAFTAGDIFGLFGNAPLWSAVNLTADLRSSEADAVIADAPAIDQTALLK